MFTAEDLQGALPKLTGKLDVRGLTEPVEVFRDEYGIPHIRAANRRDAFFAQGFVTAQDRLWHMEYDRRRGMGRWAEVVGPAAVEQDLAMRRLRLEASARADYEAVDPETREMLDAYALGVNAFIEANDNLAIEFQIAGLEPEPWQPWDGLTVYKVRHVNMGVFESKVWRAQLVRALGPEKVAAMFPGYQPGQLVILPPGAPYTGSLDDGLEALTRAAAAMNPLLETDSGSNSWVVFGSRTASGKPVLAGDSHRGLDTPNVYYQNHLACPDFDVVGASFPGVPGFPHFGHNPWVAWCVTHTAADYQDLYIERFREEAPGYYLHQDQWLRAEVFSETIRVRDSNDIHIEVYVTRHGPVISDNPESGIGISLRYTATDGPDTWPQALGNMLLARDADALVESMRPWVDPVNNFLFADVHGNIGYLCRGEIPVRSLDNARLPTPGWTGQQEWQGCIPFEELPRSVNPEQGYIVTANNRPVADDYPHYIALDFAPGFRAERVTHALLSLEHIRAEDMARVHAEAVSIPARSYIGVLRQVEPQDETSAQAREKLLAWDGRMDAARVEPTIYSAFRDALLRRVLQHNLGPELAELAWHPEDRGRGVFLNRLKSLLITLFLEDDRRLLLPGESWPGLMSQALAEGMATLREALGGDMAGWTWGRVHQARPRHTLSLAYPDLSPALDPPPIVTSGDGDTPLAGSYSPADFATVGGLSVLRYSFDLGEWDKSLWAVPLGSSGHPGSPHYHDQSEVWRKVEMVPMQYDWESIAAHRETHQALHPGA
jgi:penicillin amidase